jgi:hypothetical protein
MIYVVEFVLSLNLTTPTFSASKWLLRHDAIKAIIGHLESGHMDSASSDVKANSACLITLVKEHTRGFKDTNVNIMKAALQFFIAVCDYHEAKETELAAWAIRDGVALAVQKISDKKMSSACKELLTKLCVTSMPSCVLEEVAAQVRSSKSPVIHEESLVWFQSFCMNFGAVSIGSSLSSLVPFFIEVGGMCSVK